MGAEIRLRKVNKYVNDKASYTQLVPEAVFGFTLEEIEALQDWVPDYDGFYKEVIEAREELERREKYAQSIEQERG